MAIKDGDLSGVNASQNPALLSKQTDGYLSFSTAKFIGDVKYAYVSYAKSFRKASHFAAGIQQVGYGTISQRDEYGNETGLMHANDYCLNLSYAYDKDSLFTYGVNLKTIYSQMAQYVSVGNVIDVGATYHKPSKQLTISAVLRSMGYQWKSYTGGPKEALPFDAQLGASYKVPKAPFRLMVVYDLLNLWDLTYSDPNNPTPTVDPFTHIPIPQHPFNNWLNKFGRHETEALEFLITQNLNLRVGFNYRRRAEMELANKQGLAGFSFGLGFHVKRIQFNYGVAVYSPVYALNSLSLAFKFSDLKRSPKPPLPEAPPSTPEPENK